jgi:hypothetical protein
MSEDPRKSKVERVMVHLRIRPLSEDDINRYGQSTSVEYTDNSRGIVVLRKDYEKKTFNFDSVFDGNSRQEFIFSRVAHPVVSSVIEGYNGTIFSYGQTGTGKTYTMIGATGEFQGIIPRSAQHIFSHIQTCTSHGFTVKVGFLQIYMEMLQDLLNPNAEKEIRIREDPEVGIYLSGITWNTVTSTKDCMELMYQGDKNRNTAFTSMNSHSSRSHAVYMIKVEKRVKYNIEQLEELEKKGEKPDQSMTKSVLYLVDLAGSERVSKSKAAGSRLDEAKNINLGLLALGNCIQALSDKKAKYVPFRDSKLTRLLEDSLGGNSKTSLVVTIGPSLGHYQESISSLLFGTRAMKVENRPELNITIDYKALCAQLQAELDKINDSTSWWTIEKQQLNEKLNKANTDIENLNNDKVEMQLTIDELKLKSKEINQPAYLKISDEEIAKLKAYYKEKMKKKEQEYKKNIDEYDAQNNDLIKENTTLKKHVIDLENKNNQAKHEIKRYRDELEHEKKDRQIRINQMNSDIEDLQRALAAEKEKKEKEIIAQTYENKPDCVTMYEEILKSNEEKFRNTVEEYEQDINILRDNLTKLSLERDELAGEKYKLLQKLGVLTKKASHIAKESVRIRSETENHNQEVKILKDKNETLQKKFDDVSGKLNESEKVKEDLANNNKVLSKIHQEFINNEKIKTAQLKYITEEVYMTMKNLERMSIRFQEKMLYFITQKAQTVASAHVDASKVVESYKGIIQNMREELVKAKGK